jgi:hypothetical protein
VSKPSQPATPDPVATAKAQLGTNIGTAIAGSTLSNINQTGPGGSTTFTQNGGYTDPTTGQWVPQWNENTSLSPLGNQLLGGQQGLVNSYMPWLQQAGANTGPLDINGGANAGIVNQGPQAYDANVANAVYNQQTGFLAPTYKQQQTDLTDQLARQGIPLGSEAYGNAQTQLANTQNQGLTAAANQATSQGAQIGQGNFGLALQGQQQGVNLQQLAQTNPISLLSMLTSGAGMGGSA